MTVLMLVYTCRRALKYLLIVDGRGSSTTAPARHVSGGAPACGRPMSARSRRLSQLGPDVRTPAASRLPAPAGQGCHGPCPPTRPAAGPARETSRATSSGPRTTSPCSRKSPVPTHHGTMIIRMALGSPRTTRPTKCLRLLLTRFRLDECMQRMKSAALLGALAVASASATGFEAHPGR